MLLVRVISSNVIDNSDAFTIVDNPELPLEISMFTILESAHNAGCQKITISPMRINTVSHYIDIFDVVLCMKYGIYEFKKQHPESNLLINIIVEDNQELKNLIKGMMHEYL